MVTTSEGKVFVVSDYKHIIETSLTFKVFVNCIRKIEVKENPYFIVVGENELF
jgi:hypothetical protein